MTCTVCHRLSYSCDYAGCPKPIRRETRRQPAPRKGSMWLWLAVYFAILLWLVLLIRPVKAQDFPPPAPEQPLPRCAPRSQIVYRLANQFMEFARWQGLDERGGMVEWFGNEDTGTWTMIRTTPDMQACIVSVGQAFSASMPEDEGEPS